MVKHSRYYFSPKASTVTLYSVCDQVNKTFLVVYSKLLTKYSRYECQEVWVLCASFVGLVFILYF